MTEQLEQTLTEQLVEALEAQEEADTYFTAERVKELNRLDSIEREVKAHDEWAVLRAKAERLRAAALDCARADPEALLRENGEAVRRTGNALMHEMRGWEPIIERPGHGLLGFPDLSEVALTEFIEFFTNTYMSKKPPKTGTPT